MNNTLITRYLFKNLLQVTAFIALTLALVVWLAQSLRLLELVANADAPAGIFIRLVALSLPKFLETILPLALAISIFFTYNKMIMENEIVILRSAGLDHLALARPALLLGIGTSLFIILLSTFITPASLTAMQTLRQEIKTQYSAFLLREGVFNTFGKKMTVYLRAREANGDMVGLLIHDTREKDKPPVTITAKRGRVMVDGDVPTIVVFDGLRQDMDPVTGSLSKLYFSRYTIEVKGLEGVTEGRKRGVAERNLYELLAPDLSDPADHESIALFRAEAVHRLSSPWNALAFAAVALVALLPGPFSRQGQTRRILAGIAAVTFLQVLDMGFASFSRMHPAAAPLLPIAVIAPLTLSLHALSFRGEQAWGAIARRFRRMRTGAKAA